MTFRFGERSKAVLETVHPDLKRLCEAVLERSPVDFAIIQGNRTKDEEAALVAAGKSQTMNSRHIGGFAIDFMAYLGSAGSWDIPLYHQISDVFKQVSAELNIPIKWGGDWISFKDYDHIELDRAAYPA